jgi:putative transposase
MEAVEAFTLGAGQVDEEALLRNEYLAPENEILLSKLSDRPQLTNSERIRLAKLGNRLGLKALKDVAAIVKPETILAWYRGLVEAE